MAVALHIVRFAMKNKQILELMQPLQAADVEVRVGSLFSTQKFSGASLLLYKTARVDTRRLNEVFGAGWQCSYARDGENLVCTISVYDKELQQWVKRSNVGTKSYTEETKGEYSDALKRAGTVWGIGLELYNAPSLFMKCNVTDKNGKKFIAESKNKTLTVTHYEYTPEQGFTAIQIVNSKGEVVVNWSK